MTGRDPRDQVDALLEALPDGLPERQMLVTELTKRVGLLSARFQRAVQAELADLGLTYADFEVLAALRRAGKPHQRRPNELARDLFLTTGGTSNVLQRLTRAGLVERVPDPSDARSRWVRLTREGRRTAERAVQLAVEAQSEVLAGVPDEVARAAADALRGVVVGTNRQRSSSA